MEWHADVSIERYTCASAMIRDVVYLVPRMKVDAIVAILHKYTHNGFPVVKLDENDVPIFYGDVLCLSLSLSLHLPLYPPAHSSICLYIVAPIYQA